MEIDTDALKYTSWASSRIRRNEQLAEGKAHNRKLQRRFGKRGPKAERLGNKASRVSKQGSPAVPAEWFEQRNEGLRDRTLNYYLFGEFDENGKRDRLANCGRVPVGGGGSGSVVAKKSAAGVAHLSGYQTCGSIWACPVCAGKIRQKRAEQISDGLHEWLSRGNYVFAVTLTMPHEFGMELAPLFDCILKSWKQVLGGGARKRFWEAEGVEGTIRAFDLTYGENGWHPHLHNLIFIENTGQDVNKLEKRVNKYFVDRWTKAVKNQGFGDVHPDHGIDVRRVKDSEGIGTYISKVSFDLTRSDKKQAKKGGSNQWQLLREGRETGDAKKIALWKEYAVASKGRRCIEWSRGLKKELIGIEEEQDLTDAELAAQQTADAPLAELGPNLTGYLGNNVEAKIKALKGVEHNGADGLRYILQHDLKLRVEAAWIKRAIRGPTKEDGTDTEIEIMIPRIEIC